MYKSIAITCNIIAATATAAQKCLLQMHYHNAIEEQYFNNHSFTSVFIYTMLIVDKRESV